MSRPTGMSFSLDNSTLYIVDSNTRYPPTLFSVIPHFYDDINQLSFFKYNNLNSKLREKLSLTIMKKKYGG